MPRLPRIQYQDAAYHVFSRGNRREPLFLTNDDYAAFESMLLEAARRSGVELFNWSQMPNHVHSHLETPEGNVAELNGSWGVNAEYFNRTQHLVVHVFQGRYGARLIHQESHFKVCWFSVKWRAGVPC
jgi:REP element-mobilizing transposase RayT